MLDLIKAAAELYGDCSQELGSPDIYINGVKASTAQMDAIKAKAIELEFADAIKAKMGSLRRSYVDAIDQPIVYMGSSFQADAASRNVLAETLSTGALPNGFAWMDDSNVAVPMTFTELQGLAETMLTRSYAAFQQLQSRKDAVRSATTVAEVAAVVW